MAYFGNDAGEIMSTLDAKKLLGAVARFEVDDAPMRSKAELDRLAELDHQQYLRILDRAADNLIRASQPNPNEGLIDLYTERTKKQPAIICESDTKTGYQNGELIDLFTERTKRKR